MEEAFVFTLAILKRGSGWAPLETHNLTVGCFLVERAIDFLCSGELFLKFQDTYPSCDSTLFFQDTYSSYNST